MSRQSKVRKRYERMLRSYRRKLRQSKRLAKAKLLADSEPLTDSERWDDPLNDEQWQDAGLPPVGS